MAKSLHLVDAGAMAEALSAANPRVLVGLACAGLSLNLVLATLEFGAPGIESAIGAASYRLIIAGAAAACLVNALRRRRGRWSWGLIGGGLACWAAGDIWFWLAPDSSDAAYPWITNGLFLAFYAASLAGLFALTIKRERLPTASTSLVISVLGLATVWSWVVFSDHVGLADRDAETAATMAYPLLDLVLIAAAMVGLMANRRRLDPPLIALALGFTVTCAADLTWATRITEGAGVSGTLLDVMWPLGALLIGVAPWLDERGSRTRRREGDLLPMVLAVSAATLAVSLLILDHFEAVPLVTLILAGATVAGALAHVVVLHAQRHRAYRSAQESARRAVSALAVAVDARDHYTSDHSRRVGAYTRALGAQLNLEARQVDRLVVAGRLHDVGKIAIPDAILLKPERLGEAEYERMKEHSAEGERIVRAVGLPEEAHWIRHLHERWDGNGYPDGLREAEIPLESRILAVADAVDAMTTDRAYRARMTADAARQELLRCAGSHFDPEVARLAAQMLAWGELRLERGPEPVQVHAEPEAAPAPL